MRTAIATCATFALAFLVACSGGDKPAGTFAVPTTGRPTARPSNVTTVAPSHLRLPSAARLFAGTNSAGGQLTRYCKNNLCTEQSPHAPAFIPAPSGSIVVFTLGDAPLEAVADISTRTGASAGTVRLSPGTLMVFNHGLGPGRWVVDLDVRWRSSEARWRFGLKVT